MVILELLLLCRPVIDMNRLSHGVPDQRQAMSIGKPTALAVILAHGFPHWRNRHVVLPQDELAAVQGLAAQLRRLRAQGAHPPVLDVRIEGEFVRVFGQHEVHVRVHLHVGVALNGEIVGWKVVLDGEVDGRWLGMIGSSKMGCSYGYGGHHESHSHHGFGKSAVHPIARKSIAFTTKQQDPRDK